MVCIELANTRARFPGVVLRVGVRCSPAHEVPKAAAFNTAVQDGVHSKDVVAVDVVLGGGDRLCWDETAGELERVGGSPWEESGDMEDGVHAGHGGGEAETVGDGRDDSGDGEWTEVAVAKFGAWLILEVDVGGGETDRITNFEGDVTAGTVSVVSVACFSVG